MEVNWALEFKKIESDATFATFPQDRAQKKKKTNYFEKMLLKNQRKLQK